MSGFTKKEVERAENQILEQSKRIGYFLTEYSIELLVQKYEKNDFYIPDYQRNFTWEEDRQCRFIESVLINLPVPFLFFWENGENGRLEIVDGSQRIRTLHHFIFGELVLKNLERLPTLEGFKFSDLPISRQRKIKNKSIRGIVLDEHADEEARFDLFDRINTGSKTANKAEIRRGALGGPFMDMVIELSQNDIFISLAPMSAKSVKERAREELVTRFFAFDEQLENYRDNVAQYTYEYTKKMNVKFLSDPCLKVKFENEFLQSVAFIKLNFPWGFRKSLRGKATPRTRYEAIVLGVKYAIKSKPEIKDLNIPVDSWIESEEFLQLVTSGAANVKSKILARVGFVKNKLLGI